MAPPKLKGERLRCHAYGPSTHLAFDAQILPGDDMGRIVLERLNNLLPSTPNPVVLYHLSVDKPGETKMIQIRRTDAERVGLSERFVPAHGYGTF